MADDKNKISHNSINKAAATINDGMERLYRSTYFAPGNNKRSLEQVKSSIDKSIDDLIQNNFSNIGTSSIATMYSRLQEKRLQIHSDAIKELEELFNDPTLTNMIMNTWSANKYVREYDNDIDILCKYMPQLEEALKIKKDNILSTDHFSQDFINATSDRESDKKLFVSRIKTLKEKYGLFAKFEKYYDDASKYGETFVYVVPYKKALQKLLNSDSKFNNISESADLTSSENYSVIYESTQDASFMRSIQNIKDLRVPNISVEINRSNVLPFAIQEIKEAIRLRNSSLLESTSMFDQTIPDDTKLKGLRDTTSDGLIEDKKNSNNEFNIPGAIIHTLKREFVKPIYIEDMCMGYYYMEWLGQGDPFADNQTSSYDPMFMTKTLGNGNINKEGNNIYQDDDFVLKKLAENISAVIDKNFIENNQDLRKEIYMFLKYNDAVKNGEKASFRVSFIPPDDIEHIFFRQNPITHRGISDLDNAILPATLYTGLYMTNTLGILTRGFDKRVYYVKQSIDSNISKTLLNTINQIKKSNFGSREMTSIKHILNITGRYNDYLIPTNASGEPPIQFEIMPGQNIDLKTPLMEDYERMAINSTEVPYEMVQIRENSVDYAMQLTMTNSKFIRIVFKRQSLYNINLSNIMTKLYNYEFDETDTITVKLPPPTYLNLMQTSGMLDNNDAYCTKIMELMMPTEEDEVKLLFKKNLSKELLSTFIDYEMINKVIEQTKMEYEKERASSNDSGGNQQEE